MSPNVLLLPAPAKLNLFLHITGRREDGYHLLQTVFQFLDYADQIELKLNPQGKIQRLSEHPGVKEEDDLSIRAARLLQRTTGVKQGVDISLDKRLPMGGGLGGGSSDAATVLRGCNKLWNCGLGRHELAKLGVQLGADVPVFVHGYAAWAEGIGEQLEALKPPEPWYLVVHPGVSVSTAEIFSQQALTRNCEAIKIADFLQGRGTNVLEPVVKLLAPEVAESLQWLSEYSPARMTGSGSCIFAAFESRQAASEVLKVLPEKWKGFVAKGTNVSPLESFL